MKQSNNSSKVQKVIEFMDDPTISRASVEAGFGASAGGWRGAGRAGEGRSQGGGQGLDGARPGGR